jgi:hypothetical protein
LHEVGRVPQSSPPQVVVTIGIHASASTWVFNVVRELVTRAVGAQQVLAIYAEEIKEIPQGDALGERYLVLKCHHGSPELDAWLESIQPLMILSIRDPRDAAISMAQRFHAPLQQSAQWLLRDCQRLARLADQGHTPLRYEDRFFEDPKTLEHLAAHIAPETTATLLSELFERYRADSVRQFSNKLTSLPPERLVASDSVMMDRVTQIHRGHVGDTRSGKWMRLSPATRRELTKIFQPFLNRFGYESSPRI